MRTIIATAGTSVFRGLKKQGVSLDEEHRLAQITKEKISEWGSDTNRLSAELSTLAALEADSDDQLILLATDTDTGEEAADVVAHIADLQFGIQSDVVRVEGLVLDDADVFRKRGLVHLVEKLDDVVERARREGHEPVLGIGGGIKSVTPYAAVYGMMRQVPLAYMFEFTNRLLTMPRLPLGFDWEAIRTTRQMWAQIREEGAVESYHLRNELGEHYRVVEGLFEEEDGLATLSAFGQMLLRDVKTADQTTVFLSPRAEQTFEKSDGDPREQLEFILNRLPNPLWRDQKFNAISGTDLDVWKPGNTPERAAGWIEPHGVYVAELYTDWFHYRDDIKNHQRRNYDRSNFTPWVPKEEIDPLTDDEKATDRLQTRNENLKEERNRAREDADKHKAARKESEAQLKASEGENKQLRSQVDALRSELKVTKEKLHEMETEQQT